MARSYALARGPRVCLRLARVRDLAGIEDLLMRHGVFPSQFELARLVRADPRQRIVICGLALVGGVEQVVGVGALDLDGDSLAEPSPLVVDDELTSGLDQLLHDALVGRARLVAGRRAA